MQTKATTLYKQEKQKSLKLTLRQSLMGTCTNIIYKLGMIGGLKRMPQLLKSSPPIRETIILGQKITDQILAKQKLNKIIWFTYREKLHLAEHINSDVGWGCLPRVGQMLLAQAITKHFINKGIQIDQTKYAQIIQQFLDDPEVPARYSLNTMLKCASRKFGINPGEWFNIGYLCQIIQNIQEEAFMIGTEKLKIAFFNQSVIFLNEIMEKAQIKQCKCIDKKMLCLFCNSQQPQHTHQSSISLQQKPFNYQEASASSMITEFQESNEQLSIFEQQPPFLSHFQIIEEPTSCQLTSSWEIYDIQSEKANKTQPEKNKKIESEKLYSQSGKFNVGKNELQNHIILIVSVLTSQERINSQDYKQVLSLLSLPYSLGIIGGVLGKALYIVGFEGDQVVYLDPHYVQKHVDRHSLKQSMHTFFCGEYRKLNREALFPSLAFCFYLKTMEEILDLLHKIDETKERIKKQGRNFFISVMESNKLEDDWEKYQCESIGNFPSSLESKESNKECNSFQFRDISDSC